MATQGLPRTRERATARATRPCTAQTMRCRDARDYRHELRPCCRGHVRALVDLVASLLTEAGVVWWADYGTLLGAVRNPLTTWADYPWLPQGGRDAPGPAPGIVPHDKDADLGLLWDDWGAVQRLRGRLTADGHRIRQPKEGWLQIQMSARNNTHADLFFWRERPDGALYRDHYASVDAYKGREFPRAMLEPLSTVQWEGLALPAPADPAAFLAMRYGPTWMRPVAANHAGVRIP